TAIYKGILSDGKINSITKNAIVDKNSQETIPFFSSDGKFIFLFSNYQNQNPKNLDLWVGKYDRKGLIHDLKKATTINTDSVEYYGSMSANGHIYFSSWRKNGSGKGDIFSTKFKNGKFSAINQLDNNINNKFINSSPAISPKGDWLIFFNENEGVADLYISFLKKERWSKPIKLSNIVNTPNFEFAPVISDNGKTLYFSRREKSTVSDKQVYHIYKISIDELGLDKLKLIAQY
ncbi:TolB family protein, partial [Flavobacterium sp.]|uniref:TolB family protein n=1 Tax=Flavobacterium sp. TaxID=239 RepID=UPI003753A7CC